jgi:hypothetical protein
MGGAHLGCLAHLFGIQGEGTEQLGLAFVHEHRKIDVLERTARDAALARLPADRGDARVRVLHVVHGVLHRLRSHDVKVERLRRVDALEQERQPRHVGVDFVEDVGQGDDVAGALRQANGHAATEQLH